MSTKKNEAKTSSSSVSKKKTVSTSNSSTTKTKDSSEKKKNNKEEEKQTKEKTSRDVSKTRDSTEKLSTSISTVKKSRQNPATPPSNRVMKTQYFPSKNLYANALKLDDSSNRSSRFTREKETVKDRKNKPQEKAKLKKSVDVKVKDGRSEKPKALTLAEIKKKMRQENVAKKKKEDRFGDASPDTSSMSERPRTATLRKGSIVNANIVGPDAPKKIITKPVKPKSPSPPQSPEVNYEDDFESYESDFEAYSSSRSSEDNISGEETSTDDSSNENPPETFLKAPVSIADSEDEKKLDSGNYELPDCKHKQSLGNIQEIIEKENANLEIRINPASLSDEGFEEQKSLQFINFLDAKKKCERRKSSAMKMKRGQEILSMIRLDSVYYTIYDLPSVPYDVYIKIYGSNNTVQTSVQTGDDICEETQTDDIEHFNKWTQFPTTFSKIDENDDHFWEIYKTNYLGVGSDNFSNTKQDTFNENHLSKFLSTTADLILNILAEDTIENVQNINKNRREIPFSDGYLTFNTTGKNLSECVVSYVSICSKNKNKILTVHTRIDIDYENVWKSVICLWDIGNLEEPQTQFISYGEVSSCCFCVDVTSIVLGGQNNGTICIWNIVENTSNYNISNMSPCITTKFSEGHTSKVVSIECYLDESQDNFGQLQMDRSNISICSLSEEGEIILWTLYMKTLTQIDGILLVQNSKISLQANFSDLPDLQCTDLILNNVNGSFVYIATNYGFVLYYLLGDKSSLKKYKPELHCETTCLEICPFSPNYFFCGHVNGDINLYSKSVEKPLMILSNKEGKDNSPVNVLQWSRNRPFILYSKDSTNTINIWNLEESDIFPIYSVPFSESITCMKLSPFEVDDVKQNSYMIVGTESGNIFLHLLNSEHGQQSRKFYRSQVDTFFDYVNRL